MIRAYWGFTDYPFREDLPPRDLFPTIQGRALSARLDLLVGVRGVGLVVGPVGAGKTALVRAWAHALNPNATRVLYIHNTSGTVRGFLRILSDSFDRKPRQSRDRLLTEIREALSLCQYEYKKTPLLILDEAQSAYSCVLEEIRLLTSVDLDSPRPPAVLLVASRDILGPLRKYPLDALAQRIRSVFQVTGLDKDELKPYVGHHLRLVGCARALFTDSALALLFHEGQGLPRPIGVLALEALRLGAEKKADLIEAPLVEEVLEERANLFTQGAMP